MKTIRYAISIVMMLLLGFTLFLAALYLEFLILVYGFFYHWVWYAALAVIGAIILLWAVRKTRQWQNRRRAFEVDLTIMRGKL